MEWHDTRQQNVAVSKQMILLLGEGALSFNNNITGDYAVNNRYQHIFTMDFSLPQQIRAFRWSVQPWLHQSKWVPA